MHRKDQSPQTDGLLIYFILTTNTKHSFLRISYAPLHRHLSESCVTFGSSPAAVTASVSLRGWPRWSGDLLLQWQPAVLRSDSGAQPASSYRLTVSVDDRLLYSTTVPGAGEGETLEARYTGTLAVGTEYQVEVECVFPTRNFSCGSVAVVPSEYRVGDNVQYQS